MSLTQEPTATPTVVQEATREEGWQILDEQARMRLGISAEEFIRRWDAGEYHNCKEQSEVMHVAILLPFAR